MAAAADIGDRQVFVGAVIVCDGAFAVPQDKNEGSARIAVVLDDSVGVDMVFAEGVLYRDAVKVGTDAPDQVYLLVELIDKLRWASMVLISSKSCWRSSKLSIKYASA